MFALRIAVAVLIAGSVLLNSSEANDRPQPEQLPSSDPVSNHNTGTYNDEQQAPMFDQQDTFLLSKVNYESRLETRDERCKMFNETLRFIFSRTKPELVSASTLGVYKAAIEGLKGRNPPALLSLKECGQEPQLRQATSSIDNGSQLQHLQSRLVRLERTQEQLIRQRVGDSELFRQLENDLAQEKSRALEREREMDRESRRMVIKLAIVRALGKLNVDFVDFKQDVSRFMTDYVGLSHLANDIPTFKELRLKKSELISKRAAEFTSVMQEKLEKASNIIDTLRTKQEQEDQHCVSIKKAFNKLESDYEGFKKSLAQTFSDPYRPPDSEKQNSLDRLLKEFHQVLEEQSDVAIDYINYIGY